VARRGAAARLVLTLVALLLQSPTATEVGRVTQSRGPGRRRWRRRSRAGRRREELSGIGALPDRPIRIILAPNRQTYDSLTRGRLPLWSEGAAFPDVSTIVLLADQPAFRPTPPFVMSSRISRCAGRSASRAAVVRGRLCGGRAQEWDRFDALRSTGSSRAACA